MQGAGDQNIKLRRLWSVSFKDCGKNEPRKTRSHLMDNQSKNFPYMLATR